MSNKIKVTRFELMKMVQNGEDYSNVDTSEITDFSNLFENIEILFDMTSWDVSNGEYFNCMFCNAESFNQDISAWDVSNGEYFKGMFLGARLFNQDISDWDVSNGRDFDGMFLDTDSLKVDLSSWRSNHFFLNCDLFLFTDNVNIIIDKNFIEYCEYFSCNNLDYKEFAKIECIDSLILMFKEAPNSELPKEIENLMIVKANDSIYFKSENRYTIITDEFLKELEELGLITIKGEQL